MSDWLTDEFTATALVAIADATRKCSKAKDIAVLIKAHMEHHYEGAWQVIVSFSVYFNFSAITVQGAKFFYAKKNDFTIHIFKAGKDVHE
ncbi:unnamed protein product [Hymenolepis diminuta]|uniref:Dynein light chain n=1 Tax=Hymenolepis diminuta TaxID=6216 RepID=A0A0R3SUJ0_HYMDI|nr:unnamed protein product [Hymenolepis diminuta]